MDGHSTEALALGDTALAAHDKLLGRHHAWTKESARVTADTLDALGRTDEVTALRERYGVTRLLRSSVTDKRLSHGGGIVSVGLRFLLFRRPTWRT